MKRIAHISTRRSGDAGHHLDIDQVFYCGKTARLVRDGKDVWVYLWELEQPGVRKHYDACKTCEDAVPTLDLLAATEL